MSATVILDAKHIARALGGNVVGSNRIVAPGPNHSAADRSLSVKLDAAAPDGFVVTSFAGDDALACKDYVRSKLGLPRFNGGSRQRPSDDVIEKAVMAAAMGQGRNNHLKGKVIAQQYDYCDADGTLLYQVLRYEPKDFRQRRPDGNGGWSWKLDERRVLYRWPELLKFPDATIFITEGEKDADRVAALGQCATTVAAGKWTDECVEALAGRDVIILEDNDDAGRKKALVAAQALHCTAKTIRLIALPGLKDRGDVSDWLDADSHNVGKLIEVCFAVPEWTPSSVEISTPDEKVVDAKAETAKGNMKTIDLAPDVVVKDDTKQSPPLSFIDIAAWHGQPVPKREWTVRDRIPSRNVTLLSGEGSIGKTIIALQLGTAVVLGRDWLGTMPEPGAALVVCCEDDEKRIVAASRSDLPALRRGLYRLQGHAPPVLGRCRETLMAVPDRNGLIQPTKLFGRIREAACDIRPKLIVLDNSADIYGGNENDRAQVRQFIGILRGMAIAAGAGVLLTSHPVINRH